MTAGDVSLLPLELARWDQAPPGDALVVPVAEDVRPPRGAAGLADWRLGGALSRALRDGRFSGAREQTLTLPAGGRLPWPVVLAVGTGPAAQVDEAAAARLLEVALLWARGAACGRLALGVPGRELGRLEPGRAGAVLQSVLARWDGPLALTVIDSAPVLRVLGEALRAARPPPPVTSPA